MDYNNKSKDELKLELQRLQLEFDSLKAAYEKDITNSNKRDEALQETLSELNKSQHLAQIGNWKLSLTTNIFSASDESLRIFGLPANYHPKFSEISDCIHPADKPLATKILEKSLKTGGSYSIELRIIRKDNGAIRNILSKAEVQLDSNKKPIAIIGTNQDITERKNVEKTLRESELKYRSLIENSNDAIFCVNEKGEYQFANKTFAQTLGQEPDYFIGKSFWDIYPKEHADYRQEASKKVFETGVTQSVEVTVPLPDKNLYFLAKANPIKDESGKVVLNLTTATDITERKLAEDAVRESEMRYRTILQTTRDGFWIITLPDGKFTDVNETYCKMSGYSKEELVQLSIPNIDAGLTPDEQSATIQKIITNGSLTFETRHRRKDGSVFDVELSVTFQNQNGGELFCFCRDISERKLTEDSLRLSEERFRNIYEQSLVGITITSLDGKLQTNKTYCNILGYSHDELSKMNWQEITHPDCIENDKKIFDSILAGDIPSARWEKKYIHKNGNIVWVDISSVLVRDSNNKPLHFIASIVDISVQKKKEEELRKKTEELDNYFTNALDLFCIANTDGYFIKLNEEWENTLGYKLSELEGVRFLDLVHPDDLQTTIETLSTLTKQKPVTNFVNRYRTKNGLYRIIEWRSKPMGNLIYAAARDITERQEFQNLLQQTRTNYETFFNTIDDFLFVLDENGNIIHTNSTVTNRLGYTLDELIGKPVLFVHPIDRQEEAGRIVREMLMGDADFCPVPIVTKSNIQIPVETRISRGFWDGKPVIFGVTKDVSKIQLSEEKFSKLFHINPSACGLSDLDNRQYIEVNEAFYKLLGYSKDEVIGKTATELGILSSDLVAAVTMKSDTNGKVSNVEADLKAKNGDIKHVLLSAEIINVQDKRYRFTVVHDITERKRAEEALRLSIQKWEAIVSASPDGIGMVSFDGKIQLISDKLATMYGYTIEEMAALKGRDMKDFIDPSDQGLLLSRFKELVKGNRIPAIAEYTAIKKDGSRFYIDVNSTILNDSKGNPTSILFIERDITERKKVENALKESETRFRHISSTISDIAYSCITDVNQDFSLNWLMGATERITGYTANELIELKCWGKIVVDDDFDIFKTNVLDLSPGLSKYCELRIVHKKGHIVWIGSYAECIRSQRNNEEGLIYGGLIDISERKKTENELIQLSTRLELATIAGGVGVWELDLVNNTLIWDDQMFALYGITKNTFGGAYEAWLAGVHPDDKERSDEEINMAIRGEKEFNTEFRVLWPNGSTHNIRALSIVQRDESGKPLRMIGTNWEITAQKQNEANLIRAKFEAEIANKSKSIFLANMSHEIRTPLNAIIGFSQLLNRDPQLTSSQREYNTSIITAGEHLLELINDILELSKVEAGRVVLNPSNVDLYSLLNDIKLIFKERAESKNLQFIFETADNLPHSIIVDESKLRRLYINLIGNAIKFTDEGGIAVRTRITKTDDDTYRLSAEVQDSGVGIAENEIGKLFKHFMQTSSGIKKGSGTGLGLALCNELVTLMGGKISVTSKEGVGSIFSFYIEVKDGIIEPVEPIVTKRVVGLAAMAEPIKILVVDDRVENLKVVVNLLKLVGFETIEAINGIDAIEKFEKFEPKLILMDMRMPIMDGYEATRRIKNTEKGKKTPVIALTASSFEEEQKKIDLLKMQGYIRKPFRESELFNIIGDVLGVQFIYEDSLTTTHKVFLNDDEIILQDLSKLPNSLVVKMIDALAVADLDLLIEQIHIIKPHFPELAQHLLKLANNYDYANLIKILNTKDNN